MVTQLETVAPGAAMILGEIRISASTEKRVACPTNLAGAGSQFSVDIREQLLVRARILTNVGGDRLVT